VEELGQIRRLISPGYDTEQLWVSLWWV